MAKTMISAKIDAEDKRQFEEFCSAIGLTPTELLNVFIRKVVREQRVSFVIGIESGTAEGTSC